MDKKSVGVVGYWFATNYGGVATYYSLYRQIEKLGYAPFFVENPYVHSDWEGLDTFPRQFLSSVNARISECYTMEHLRDLNHLADTFVLGSDQVVTKFSIKNYGKLFLMDFAEGKRKIAMSASCGGDNLEGDSETINFAKKCLRDFSAVSVREYSAVDILYHKLGIHSEVMADPIFFTSKEEYMELADETCKEEEPYMLAYVLDPSPDKRDALLKIAEKKNLKLKIALDGRKYTYENNYEKMGLPEETLPQLDFRQWLYYYSNASYVFTDSFHGAAMSLIMNKQFIMYANHMRGYPRFLSLAKMFDVHSRLVDNNECITDELLHDELDYEVIQRMIEERREQAAQWLKRSMEAQKEELPPVVSQVKIMEERLHQDPDFIKIRMLATLLRDYGVKHVVLSPGGRDVPLVRMFEHNADKFVIHSVTDERSAAYYGMGIAAQLQQPVACVCTSGTAVSNYLPAVTEAYFTGVPLIMITADRRSAYLNQGEDQTIPQKNIFGDVVKKSISLPEGGGYLAEYQARRDISDCILESTHNGFGPVHINVSIENIGMGHNLPKESWDLLPRINPHILRVCASDGDAYMMRWVEAMRRSPRILVVYGQHAQLTAKQKADIELFVSKYNCVVVTDLLSNLDCSHSIDSFNLLSAISQQEFNEHLSPDILITVGGKRLMNDPLTFKVRSGRGDIRHWSVTPDGKIKDFYFRLSSVIELSQDYFFEWFANHAGDIQNNGEYYGKWKQFAERYGYPTSENFDSHYIQRKFIPAVPSKSLLHLGVGQTFIFTRRYPIDKSVEVFCNMGTNGIDGCTSTFMGQCAVAKDKLCFLIVGDLSFFYDMNSIWNKELTPNMRILLVNNNGTGLLRNHGLKAVSSVHNTVAKGWVESTGFKYMSANSREEFDALLPAFLSKESDQALFFEVFCE